MAIRVLIIDDSLTIRAVMEQVILHDPECEIAGIVADAEAARALVTSAVVDVITLDLAMPGIDGLHFLDELATLRHAPVVVVSSSTKAGTAAFDEALARGADACFDKGKLVSEAPRFLSVLKRVAKRKRRRAGSPRPDED